MEWIKCSDRLPDCWSQHGNTYSSGYLLVFTKYGDWEIDEYRRTGKHTGDGFVVEWEGWSQNNIENVTYWQRLTDPTKQKSAEQTNNELASYHAAIPESK